MMINTFFNQNCVSDVKGGEAGHWTEVVSETNARGKRLER